MKKLNIFLTIVLLILLALAGWYLIGGTLNAEVYSITAPASEHPDAYASIQNVILSGSAPQQFAAELPSIENCTLVDTTITLANNGLFPAEWLDIRVEASDGDIAVYSLTGEGSDLAARSIGQVNLKLITTARPDAVRTIRIQYYVYGMPRTLTIVG